MYCKQEADDPTWAQLKKEISRMAGLDGYPKPEFEPEAFRELVIALQNADTLEDARDFIGDVILCEMHCPKPAELRRMIGDVRERRQGSTAARQVETWKQERRLYPSHENEILECHARLLEARSKEAKGMNAEQRRQPTRLSERLKIANEHLRDRVTDPSELEKWMSEGSEGI